MAIYLFLTEKIIDIKYSSRKLKNNVTFLNNIKFTINEN